MPRGRYERNYGEGVCAHCGATFTKRMQIQRFCTPDHRGAARYGVEGARRIISAIRLTLDEQERALDALVTQ